MSELTQAQKARLRKILTPELLDTLQDLDVSDDFSEFLTDEEAMHLHKAYKALQRAYYRLVYGAKDIREKMTIFLRRHYSDVLPPEHLELLDELDGLGRLHEIYCKENKG